MDNSESFSSLYEIILDVSTHLGFSVIPLTGKRPPKGFDFSKYQTQHPSADELHTWFSDENVTSYGVVCGAVSSHLVVLDFDSESAYHTFTALFPAFALSYTVKTRRGYHIYLRSQQALRTRKMPGGDLLAQGSLVVGAGSQINDFYYTVVLNTPILTLSNETLKSLLTWADQASQSTIINQKTDPQPTRSHSLSQIVSLYQKQAPAVGRNNALYRAAVAAAQTGFNQSDVIGSLALAHITAPAPWMHPKESTTQRLQEAHATIKSAYQATHQRRRAHPQKPIGLPNALRETLLRVHQSTVTARLLDSFILAGWSAGRSFSTLEAVEMAAQYGLGRSSVLAVLSGKLSQINGQRLIPTRDSKTEKAYSHSHKPTHNPVWEVEDRRFNSRGRKPNLYLVPDLNSLCQICSVSLDQMGSIDPLTAQDMVSEKAYRMALHRELIKRTSPELSYRWHAHRLSVSARTVRSYNAVLGVIVTPIFGYLPLTWATLEHEDLWGGGQWNASQRQITPGRWIQSAAGKRYPAIKGIACQLLKVRFQLITCKRMPSRFQLPVADHPIILHACLWRRMDGAAPDWGGGEHDFPMHHASLSDNTHSLSTCDTLPQPDNGALIQFVKASLTRPQDLKVLKGVGAWYESILNQAGIMRYRHLAQANAEHIAGLSGMGDYVTAKQAAFWMDQARVLVTHKISCDELQGWSYKDWYAYDFERGRIEGASATLRQKLASEFREKGWLKYHGVLPEWFIELVNT